MTDLKPCPWQPIETAPQDGTVILATSWNIDSGEWNDPEVVFWFKRDSKYNWTNPNYGLQFVAYAFERWQPLPTPPKETTK